MSQERWTECEFDLASFLHKRGLAFDVIADALSIGGFASRRGTDVERKLRREGRHNLVEPAVAKDRAA